jgi:hypothetical protein
MQDCVGYKSVDVFDVFVVIRVTLVALRPEDVFNLAGLR